MVEWSITTDCKSVTLWVTKVRILLCAPIKRKVYIVTKPYYHYQQISTALKITKGECYGRESNSC